MLKKITLLSCLLAIFFIAQGAHSEEKPYDEAISLGNSCQVTWQLKANGFRTFAYPFDWFHTPSTGLLGFITYQGSNFFDIDKISVIGPYPGDPICLQVMDLNFGIMSYHDFTSNPPFANYWDVKLKYDRRIKRFFNLLNSNKKVLLVRLGDSRQEIECLDYLLQQNYPKLNYTILAVHETEDFKLDWGLDRIKNYYIKQIPWNWQGDVASWKAVLENFHIKTNNDALLND
ncbi:MAG: hypothetical protein H0V82_02840 [Candidatus Protochlamydia sp.]|nr:hypothetical protein [Candidatus Protochlamydia sp.]